MVLSDLGNQGTVQLYGWQAAVLAFGIEQQQHLHLRCGRVISGWVNIQGDGASLLLPGKIKVGNHIRSGVEGSRRVSHIARERGLRGTPCSVFLDRRRCLTGRSAASATSRQYHNKNQQR